MPSRVHAEKFLNSGDLLFVLLALAISAAAAVLITPLAKRLAVRLGIIDVPKDARRMHSESVPMFGGFAIVCAFLLGALPFLEYDITLVAGITGALIMAVLGAFDDKYDIPAWIKLIIQLAAAAIPVIAGLRIEFVAIADSKLYLQWLAIPITILWIVGLTNAVNFIDGLDGLAAGASGISSVSLCLLAIFLGRADSAVLTAAVAGACFGFLPYNRHPAKIFMGDMGATFLGYIMAFISVYGLFKTSAFISFAGPVVIMALPIFDTLWAIVRRVLKGQSPMTADRGHIHHWLVDHGLSQRVAVRVVYMICIMCSAVAIVLAFFGALWAMLLAAVCIAAAILVARSVIKTYKRGKNEISE